jgi:NAD-dependent dihydropyrimidine dehydrogenase PreA subunit
MIGEMPMAVISADLVVTKSEKTGHAIAIDEALCKGCTICVEICPKDVLEMVDMIDRWEGATVRVRDIDACIACFICEHECPDFALLVYAAAKKPKPVEAQGV